MSSHRKNLIVIGGGPAGLTSAYVAQKESKGKIKATVLEMDSKYVGGISRTEEYKGYRFDIGGHRFFSKSQEIEDLWTEIAGDEMLDRPRLSRIYYDKKFFDYPIKPFNAFKNLGLFTTIGVLLSYAKVRLFPIKDPKTFEDWVTNEFGYKLYSIFFKTYTEKVWGMPCNEISADWAAQRIKGLSISTLILTMLKSMFTSKKSDGGDVIKTLITQFRYPKHGPGQLWEIAAEKIKEQGGEVQMGEKVIEIKLSKNKKKIESVITKDLKGKTKEYKGDFFVSTMPMNHLIKSLTPEAPKKVSSAANNLKYRDFLTVILIADKEDVFPDNWIYIHDPDVKLGRIQNFKNWSPFMVPDESKSSLGLEYFCFEGDGLWTMKDKKLIELGKKEIDQIGLIDKKLVKDGYVVRMPKAYPVYDHDYQTHVDNIRSFVDKIQNLYLVGRNGMHRYNNQDHSMMSAIVAVRNMLGNKKLDPWKVNADAEYHEEVTKDEGRKVPEKVK